MDTDRSKRAGEAHPLSVSIRVHLWLRIKRRTAVAPFPAIHRFVTGGRVSYMKFARACLAVVAVTFVPHLALAADGKAGVLQNPAPLDDDFFLQGEYTG